MKRRGGKGKNPRVISAAASCPVFIACVNEEGQVFAKETMAGQATDTINQGFRVKATFKLGSELYPVNSCSGNTVSKQLVSMKEQSMSFLKEFITKHNVPNDVPDELAENSLEDDEVLEKP